MSRQSGYLKTVHVNRLTMIDELHSYSVKTAAAAAAAANIRDRVEAMKFTLPLVHRFLRSDDGNVGHTLRLLIHPRP